MEWKKALSICQNKPFTDKQLISHMKREKVKLSLPSYSFIVYITFMWLLQKGKNL